ARHRLQRVARGEHHLLGWLGRDTWSQPGFLGRPHNLQRCCRVHEGAAAVLQLDDGPVALVSLDVVDPSLRPGLELADTLQAGRLGELDLVAGSETCTVL